jgi:GT2 family glycosyltransferase
MDLSIIVINYKNYHLTKKCIDSVLNTIKNISYEIIIIDNNSPNDSYECLQSNFMQFKNIQIIRNSLNSGFGAANNLAVNYATGNYLLFLNPDVIVLNDSIVKMYEKFLNNEEIGLISCKLLNKDLSLQHSCRRFLTFHEFIFSRTPLKKLVNRKYRNKLNSKYLMYDFNHKNTESVDWVMGSCMLMEKNFFNFIGGFSKEYFMYFEDVDLCYKIHLNNRKVLYYSDAHMIHLHNQESVKKVNKLTYIHLTSMIKFYLKYKKINTNQ